MNAFELNEMLNEYTEKELKAMPIRVFANMDINEGDITMVDSVEVTEFGALLIEI